MTESWNLRTGLPRSPAGDTTQPAARISKLAAACFGGCALADKCLSLADKAGDSMTISPIGGRTVERFAKLPAEAGVAAKPAFQRYGADRLVGLAQAARCLA